jgi:hypothetical protein
MKINVCKGHALRLFVIVFGTLILLLSTAVENRVAAQGAIRLVPVGRGAKVKLAYKGKSVVLDVEDESRLALPGDEPHRYKTLFSASKDGFLYTLAQVCSGSPISDPNAPCGGDRPCALLWIKTDASLKNREIKIEIYASCSYNYYEVGKTRIKGSKLTIRYQKGAGSREYTELTYDNKYPEKGIAASSLLITK